MNYPPNHYQVIHAFFDCYGLSQAVGILNRIIKTADKENSWKGRSPSDVLFYMDNLTELAEAAFSIVETYDHKNEVILDHNKIENIWSLAQYHTWCGWHTHATPWDFFPRHLSKKEFLDPYRALEKFTAYRSLHAWKETLKDILFHALSPTSIAEFDDGTSILGTWLHLHKLLEASHLIEVRNPDNKKQSSIPKKDSPPPVEKEETGMEEEAGPSIEELAWVHIKEFFLVFGEEGAREELWAMLKRSLSNKDDETPATDRSNMIFVYEQLTELIDDIHVLHRQKQGKQNPAKTIANST